MTTLCKPFLLAVQHLVNKHLLALLVLSYVIAAACPAPGLWIRGISFGAFTVFSQTTRVTLPMVMLAFLLFNAGLGVKLAELRALAGRPSLPATGLAANLVIPILFILGVSSVMRLWHNPDEVQNILVGLALVASMPIAGSSTAWSQNADGDLALSLGLVVGSTLLSPFATPLALHAIGLMAQGDYAEDLHELAAHGTGAFLAICVIAPSLLGISARLLIGESRFLAVKPWLRLANALILLLLCYANAAVALPQAVARPDFDFLAAILIITTALCLIAFGSGWAIARLLRTGREQRTAMMYGLGMNNNGTGLVLASMALADHPQVMLPIIFYNLVQQIVAGAAGSLTGAKSDHR